MDKLILFGSDNTVMAYYYYFTHDSPYEVVAFTVNQKYLDSSTFLDLPLVAFEDIETVYPPDKYGMAIPLGFSDVNQLRAERYYQAKAKGYQLINYISSRALVWGDLDIGDNVFLHENANIKPWAKLGSNIIVESGALVGHHAVVGDHCFLGPSSLILGEATIGDYTILGANSTIRDGVKVGRECIIGASALIAKDTQPKSVHMSDPAKLLPGSSHELSALLLRQTLITKG